jgi:hypothetical protein
VHTLFLRSDGRAVAVGLGPDGETLVPPLPEGSSYVDVSAGRSESAALVEPVGAPYCFGADCPCDNPGAADAGCANSSGAGARLIPGGLRSVAQDSLSFRAEQLLPGQPALLFAGQNAVAGGAGVPFGDGLRCAGGGVVRLGVQTPDSMGGAQWGPGLAASGGFGAGETRYFQCWYRDPVNGPCGSGFNLTNGVELVYTP